MNKFRVFCRFDLNINEKMLNYIYQPIVGNTSVILYNLLLNEYNFHQILGNRITFDENHILSLTNMTLEQFNNSKNNLEAIGLIKTYIDPNKQENISIEICEPLQWDKFTQNPKFVQLLKNKLPSQEFDRLKFAFDGNDDILGLINVSKTFEQVFSNIEEIQFDFNNLYDDLFKMTNNLISISYENKFYINSLFTKDKINYNNILNSVYASIYKFEDKLFIDEKILKLKIDGFLNIKNLNNFNQIIQVNRNYKIFLEDITEEEMNYVLSDYQSLNSEQYLSCIQKSAIDKLEIKLIEMLRSKYQLPDFIINILLDFSIIINNGRIEPSYIQKIAISINRLGLVSITKIIEHLKNAAKSRMTFKNDYTKVNW